MPYCANSQCSMRAVLRSQPVQHECRLALTAGAECVPCRIALTASAACVPSCVHSQYSMCAVLRSQPLPHACRLALTASAACVPSCAHSQCRIRAVMRSKPVPHAYRHALTASAVMRSQPVPLWARWFLPLWARWCFFWLRLLQVLNILTGSSRCTCVSGCTNADSLKSKLLIQKITRFLLIGMPCKG